MNTKILSIIVVVVLICVALFYVMSKEATAPTVTETESETQTPIVGDTIETEVDQDQNPEPTPTDQDPFIGLSVEAAQTYAQTNDIMFRIGRVDGEFMALTMDYRPGRITAEVENGVIVDYSVE